MTLEELDAIARIGQAAFSPWWQRDGFLEEVRRDPARALLLAPDETGNPVAFIDYRRELDELHIYNLATAEPHRRKGYASRLLRRVISKAPAQGVRQILLEVRRGNEPAIRLYRRFGFKTIGVRPLYYDDPNAQRRGRELGREDGLFMRLLLSDLTRGGKSSPP